MDLVSHCRSIPFKIYFQLQNIIQIYHLTILEFSSFIQYIGYLKFELGYQAVLNMINHPLFYLILRHTELMQYANHYNNNREIQAV